QLSWHPARCVFRFRGCGERRYKTSRHKVLHRQGTMPRRRMRSRSWRTAFPESVESARSVPAEFGCHEREGWDRLVSPTAERLESAGRDCLRTGSEMSFVVVSPEGMA